MKKRGHASLGPVGWALASFAALAMVLAYLVIPAGAIIAGDAGSSVPGPPSNVEVSTPLNPTTAATNPGIADPFSATVSWAAPVTGGSPTGYTATASPEQVEPTTTSTSGSTTSTSAAQQSSDPITCNTTSPTDSSTPPTSCEVTGLSSGVPYTFSVVATDAAGQGVSVVSSATVVATDSLSVVVTPADGVVDGEALGVTVTRVSASFDISLAWWSWCEGGSVLPPTATGNTLTGDTACTGNISEYAPSAPDDFTIASPNGSGPSVAGTVIGQVGTAFGVTCDFGNPCDLGLSVQTASLFYQALVPVEYANPSLQSFGCPGGLASDPVLTKGPTR